MKVSSHTRTCPNDNNPTFVMDKDAYGCNPDFMKECNLTIDMYKGRANAWSPSSAVLSLAHQVCLSCSLVLYLGSQFSH